MSDCTDRAHNRETESEVLVGKQMFDQSCAVLNEIAVDGTRFHHFMKPLVPFVRQI